MDLSGTPQGAGGVGGLLSVVANGGAVKYFPAYDGNGNVSDYVDQTGAAVAHFEYDPFGNLTVDSYNNAAAFPYRFSTKPQDGVTGLYYYGYRWFDPVTGQWPSRDPIGELGGVNLYGFVGNDSTGNVDFLGLKSNWSLLECFLAVIEVVNYANENLIPELKKYDPVSDAEGNHPIAPHKGGGVTTPGGHYKEIKGFQQGIKKRLIKIIKNCKDDDDSCGGPGLKVPYPKWLDEVSNRVIVVPPGISPEGPGKGRDKPFTFPRIDTRTGVITEIGPDGEAIEKGPGPGVHPPTALEMWEDWIRFRNENIFDPNRVNWDMPSPIGPDPLPLGPVGPSRPIIIVF